jgi:ZIP family zinc transporter
VDVAVLLAAGTATALATGLGAVPVFFLGTRSERLRPALWGFAAGSMGVVSIVGLLAPALDEGSAGQAALGLAIGILFMLSARRYLQVHRVRVRGRDGEGVRSSVLVFAVLFVHSFPEGLAIGTAYASDTAGLSLFVIVAIALQNIPEGTSVAIPMAAAGFGRAQQFWAAVVTSVPQPVAAVIAYALVEKIDGLLPVSFAFAAGAMLSLVVLEVLPEALARPGRAHGIAGAAAGAALMLAFSAALGV